MSSEQKDLFDENKKKVRCFNCDATMVEYRHKLSSGLVVSLAKLAEAGGKANLQELPITKNQYTNFYKLRYWELAEPTHQNGEWQITELGLAFLLNETSVPLRVWSYRTRFPR